MSNSLQPHEPQYTRPPCPSPTPGVHLDSRPLSQWCHPAISSSVVPFSFCPQSLLASESFPMSQLFAWGGQSTERNANQNYSEISPQASQRALIKMSTNSKCWEGCGEKGTVLHCWWECKLIQPLWKMTWRFLKKLGIKLPYDSAIPLLGIYP